MKTKIYICTHTDFESPVHNSIYEVLDSRKLGSDLTKEGLPGFYYSELTSYRYICENFELPEYIGFCGYRKYYRFMDNVTEQQIIDGVNKHGCICGQLADFGRQTVREQYYDNHNKEDLELLEQVILDVQPDFILPFERFLSGRKMYCCNMFITKTEDFRKMMDFVFRIMDEFTKRIGPDIFSRTESAFKRGLLHFGTIKHQSRIGGYLGERLVSSYIMDKYPKAVAAGMVTTGGRL